MAARVISAFVLRELTRADEVQIGALVNKGVLGEIFPMKTRTS